MKHTENGIRVHKLTTGCDAIFEMEINDKGDLGKHELYRCTGTHTKGKFAGLKCTYVGRGKQLTEEDIEKIEAKAERQAEKAQQRKEAIADRDDLGEADASAECPDSNDFCNPEELEEGDAPVAELNETTNRESDDES